MDDAQYLAALRTYWKRHQAFPSMAKLCDVVALASTSSVFELVGRLTKAGYLERTQGRIASTRRSFAWPLVSTVRAGVPQPVGQDGIELLTIDDYLIDDPISMYSRPLVPTQPARLMQVLDPRVTVAIQGVKRSNQLLTLIVSILSARIHCKKNAKLNVPLDTLVASTLASTWMPSPSSARESSLKPMSFKASSARRIRRASREIGRASCRERVCVPV